MLRKLCGWQGGIQLNGVKYGSYDEMINSAPKNLDHLHILLTPKEYKNVVNVKLYRITVKDYMLRESNANFDFMAKWNDDVPMPEKTMVGIIEDETRGMVKMSLWYDELSNFEAEPDWCGWIIRSAIIEEDEI